MRRALIAALAASALLASPAFANQLPAVMPAGGAHPGSACRPAELGRVEGSVTCREVRGRSFWVASARTAEPSLRSQEAGTPLPAGLADRLRQGGLTIFWRHTHTDWNQRSVENPRQAAMIRDLALISDCGAQRNLADYGRDQARVVGEAFARLNLPVAEVVTSPFCRTRETAGLFAMAPVRIDYGLFDTFAMGADPQVAVIRAALRRLLSTQPPPGQNRIMVGHALNLTQAGGPMVAEGEMAIFEPTGDGFRLVARVQSPQWAGLR